MMPIRVQRSADVRADDVVGALELGGLSNIVVRQRKPHGADVESREELRQPDMAAGVRIPLREHDDDRLIGDRPRLPRVEHARGDAVVDVVRRGERARERQRARIIERIVARGARVIERVACVERLP